MTRFPKEMTENGIHYTLHGDYYFPDLDLPDSPRQTIGRYGRMRKAYLEEHRPGLYERLLLSGGNRSSLPGSYGTDNHPDGQS